MSSQTLRQVVVEKSPTGEIAALVQPQTKPSLEEGQVLVRVVWSSLNYKDALAVTGHPGVVSKFPAVPGIDAAGEIAESRSARFQPGEQVLVTGYDLGVKQPGGWSSYVVAPEQWIVPLPPGLTLREAMILGTAGFTAALSCDALHRHGVLPDGGEVLVTGATGGVGSLALRLLSHLGYRTVAVTGKAQWAEQLQAWGAKEVLGREALQDDVKKPMLAARWSGVVDCVGGSTLVAALKQTKPGGCVAASGLAGGVDLPLTVYPFILRGVTLAGIDSVWCDSHQRESIWQRLGATWKISRLHDQVREVGLEEALAEAPKLLRGEAVGRVIVSPAH